jgi:hypothetical protein
MYIVYCLYYYETDLKDFIVLHRLLSRLLCLEYHSIRQTSERKDKKILFQTSVRIEQINAQHGGKRTDFWQESNSRTEVNNLTKHAI